MSITSGIDARLKRIERNHSPARLAHRYQLTRLIDDDRNVRRRKVLLFEIRINDNELTIVVVDVSTKKNFKTSQFFFYLSTIANVADTGRKFNFNGIVGSNDR